jgi:hypothetical protein
MGSREEIELGSWWFFPIKRAMKFIAALAGLTGDRGQFN